MQYCWLVLKVMQDFIPGASILAGFNRNFAETWLLVFFFSGEHGMLYFQMCWFVYSWMYQASWMHSSKLWRWIWAGRKPSATKTSTNHLFFEGFSFFLFYFLLGWVGGWVFPSRNSVKMSFVKTRLIQDWRNRWGTGLGWKRRQNLGSFTENASHRMDKGTFDNAALRPK